MKTICACGLNDVNPQFYDHNILLQDVHEFPAVHSAEQANIAARQGTRLLRTRRASLSVGLDFELHELDPVRRLELCRYLATWAQGGGWLTLSHRPGQRLLVTCDAPPVLGSALRWLEPVTVMLTAWEAPWWEAVVRTEAGGEGTSGEVTLTPPGELETVLKGRFTARGPVDSLRIATEGAVLEMHGLGLKAGETLILDYDDLFLPRLMVGERSCLQCRTAESPEDVVLRPGEANRLTWQSDGPMTMLFTTRGRFL